MNKYPWFLTLEELKTKPTKYLKDLRTQYRGVKFGLTQYHIHGERTNKKNSTKNKQKLKMPLW